MLGVERSVEAAGSVLRDIGVAFDYARVLYEGSSVIVGLGPGRPVARVGGLTAEIRDVRAHYSREVAIAHHLSASGAAVVRPWEPAGPFVHQDLVISLWHEATTTPPPSPLAAGDGLRNCHQALRSFRGEIPPLGHWFAEAEGIVASLAVEDRDRRLFDRAFVHARDVLSTHGLPVQPLHGDAGLGNVLADGVWHDWEDSSIGPIVWDLAALVSTARITGARAERAEATLRAYGHAPGLELLDTFVALRGLPVLAWSLLASTTERHLRASTKARLDWFRTYPWDR